MKTPSAYRKLTTLIKTMSFLTNVRNAEYEQEHAGRKQAMTSKKSS
jgi:hypothetical protein